MTHIVILDGYTLNPGDNPWNPLQKIGSLDVYDRTAPEELLERAREADVLITNKVPISAEAIAKLPKLKLIAVTATGFNMVDVDAARSREIPVSNVPVYGTTTVAQFTWALILELCHRVGQHTQSVAAGDWAACPDFCYWQAPQIELVGKRLGLVGHGRIAQKVAAIGRAFGMEILATERTGFQPPTSEDVRWLSTEELFAEADIVTLHCPLTPETDQMVDRTLLSRMRRDAFLINASRGGLVNEHDLADALQSQQIAGAAVDVVSVEPMQADNPLLSAPNCLITPHMAWSTLAARKRIMKTTADNISAFLAGQSQNDVT